MVSMPPPEPLPPFAVAAAALCDDILQGVGDHQLLRKDVVSSSATNLGCVSGKHQTRPQHSKSGSKAPKRNPFARDCNHVAYGSASRVSPEVSLGRGIEPIGNWHREYCTCACKPIHIYLCDTQITSII